MGAVLALIFMLTLPEDLENTFQNYKINFVDAERLTNVEEFSEDLQVILAMLRYRNSRAEGEGKHECSRSFR